MSNLRPVGQRWSTTSINVAQQISKRLILQFLDGYNAVVKFPNSHVQVMRYCSINDNAMWLTIQSTFFILAPGMIEFDTPSKVYNNLQCLFFPSQYRTCGVWYYRQQEMKGADAIRRQHQDGKAIKEWWKKRIKQRTLIHPSTRNALEPTLTWHPPPTADRRPTHSCPYNCCTKEKSPQRDSLFITLYPRGPITAAL